MFQLLCHWQRVHPAFVEIVTSFGFKIADGDGYFTPSSSSFENAQNVSYGKDCTKGL